MDIDTPSDFLGDEEFEAWLAEHEEEVGLPVFDDDSAEGSEAGDRIKKPRTKRHRKPAKNAAPEPDMLNMEVYTYGDFCLRAGQSIETIKGSFMIISAILKNVDTNEVFLRGQFYRRNKKMKNHLPKKLNELCWICEEAIDNGDDLATQSMVDIPLEEFLQIRFIVRTNRPYPDLSFRDDPEWLSSRANMNEEEREKAEEEVERTGVLVCRIKRTTTWATEEDRLGECKPVAHSYTTLASEECDQDEASLGDLPRIRGRWRCMPTIKGGSCPRLAKGEKEFHRQEGLSTRGQRCEQSLRTATKEYPKMSIMERQFVGTYYNMDDIAEGKGHTSRQSTVPASSSTKVLTQSSPYSREPLSVPSTSSRGQKRMCNGLDTMPVKIPRVESSIVSSREKTSKSGLQIPSRPKIIDSNKRQNPDRNEHARKSFHIPRQRYEFADAFCGAGGVSRGATMAGFKVVYGFDHDIDAGQSFIANNFESILYNVEADQFITMPEHYDLRVDVLHLSPPCQFFSGLHTRPGQDDEKNVAAQYALEGLLKRCKPRIVTLEQTAGLLVQKRHRQYFNSIIQQFTSQGYNVRWALLQCADYGVPQRRPRLFMIASCPGEPLPNFPEPTHARKPGNSCLKPWTTIDAAIASIPEDWPNHNPETVTQRDEKSYSGDKVVNCICTAGKVVHPSGKRDSTERELACLSTFPLCHKFRGKKIRKQIGNAVPPLMAKILLTEVRRCLMKTDGLEWDGE